MKLLDLHNDIDAAFPGVILGISQKDNAYTVNQWVEGVTKAQQAAVNAFIASYDFDAPTQSDIDAEIAAKLKEAANDKSMADEDFVAYKRKLERAKYIDNVIDKQAKVAEAQALKRP